MTPVSTRLGGGVFEFTAAAPALRVGAGVVDLLLVFLAGGLPFWLVELQQPGSVAGLPLLLTLFALGLLYLSAAFGFKGRTVGQWYFGLMIATTTGREVWPGRGFCLALLTLLTGWSLLLQAVLPGRRSLADRLCGVRTIRDRVVGTL